MGPYQLEIPTPDADIIGAASLRILVSDPIHEDGLKILRKSGTKLDLRFGLTEDQLAKALPDYDGLIVRGRTKVSRRVLEAGRSRLRVVARAGVGLDNIDVEAAEALGIKVISTPSAPTSSVAELTVGLVLSLLRKIPLADASLKSRRWIKQDLMGEEVRRKKVGVVGVAGRIGFEVARILVHGFGTSVIGYDIIDARDLTRKVEFSVARTLEELLSQSDIVTIHVPYSPKTHHLLGEREIATMKNGSYLINTSRADIVDGRALLSALKQGRIAGAGLDVFHGEPPKEDWEWELVTLVGGRTVCTCHIGAQTFEAQRLASLVVAEETLKVLTTDRK